MASTTCLFLILIYINIAVCDFRFVNVNCNPGHGQFGHQSLLECIVSLSEEAKGVKITKVYWYNDQLGPDTPLISYTSSDHSSQPRFTLAEPNWTGTNLNVSMLVNNTMITDIGSYTCKVVTVSGCDEASTNLSVSAPYSHTVISSVTENDTVTALSCIASDGYPEERIRWLYENGTDLTPGPEQDAIKTADGRFKLSSKLELPDSTYVNYGCVVNNSLEATFYTPSPSTSPFKGAESKVVVSVCSILGTILLLVVVVILMLRKRAACLPAEETPPEHARTNLLTMKRKHNCSTNTV